MQATIIERERARVTSAHIVLGWSEAPPFYALAGLEEALTEQFAGFLRTTAEGRWYEEREVSLAYDFTSDLNEDATAAVIHHTLEAHAGDLGVEWVHIETWPSRSHHVRLLMEEHAGTWPRADRTRDELVSAGYEPPEEWRRQWGERAAIRHQVNGRV